MKKLIGIGIAAAISFGTLSGCSLLREEANGFIAYGTEQQVQQLADQKKNDVKEKNVYKMKLTTLEDKKVLVMNKKTSEDLVKKELFKKIVNEDTTKAIDKLPAVIADQGVLFAKEEVKDITIDGIKVKYEGNTIIGDARSYADMFAIVDDTVYNKIKGEEKSVGVLRLNKDPKNEMKDIRDKAEQVQLVKIKK
ncbi:hypothetical protein AMR94_06630 [Bacillus sp. G3(2015)]|uniref:lipoprotein BA_5634 family protein n=1 Tax=Bacillus sp. G3(2015) TaxID=1706731 RepID=UPI000738C973|nr:lipoprotein BA_5634 family protein [Bacillus sp. G3(2015)]KUF32902.1 hypothetical protein AMR94_06630 [Bacillus sp. G3(2015)]